MSKTKREVDYNSVSKDEYYTTGEFLDILKSKNLPHSLSWFYWSLRKGRLPKKPFKRFTRGANMRISGDNIIKIVKFMEQ